MIFIIFNRWYVFLSSTIDQFWKRSKVKILNFRVKDVEEDKKDFLDVNLESVKQRWPAALIFPEH